MKTLVALLTLSLAALSHAGEKEEQFWKWFLTKENGYQSTAGDLKGALDAVHDISVELDKVNPALRAIYGGTKGKMAITITADYKIEHFKSADELVSAAPKIEGWTIHSLVQPKNLNLDPTNKDKEPLYRYTKTINKDGLWDITCNSIHPNNMDDPKMINHIKAQYKMLMCNILGERLYATKIGKITIQHFDEDTLERATPIFNPLDDITEAEKPEAKE